MERGSIGAHVKEKIKYNSALIRFKLERDLITASKQDKTSFLIYLLSDGKKPYAKTDTHRKPRSILLITELLLYFSLIKLQCFKK